MVVYCMGYYCISGALGVDDYVERLVATYSWVSTHEKIISVYFSHSSPIFNLCAAKAAKMKLTQFVETYAN